MSQLTLSLFPFLAVVVLEPSTVTMALNGRHFV